MGGRTLGLIAASAIVTILGAPLERRLRRLVDHLFFGERAAPYTVLSTLGAELEASGDPGDALERLVETSRTSLKVSYSAVELDASPPGGIGTAFLRSPRQREPSPIWSCAWRGVIRVGIWAPWSSGSRPGTGRVRSPSASCSTISPARSARPHQNVARHAAASSCHLARSVEPAGVRLRVEDDGNVASSNGAAPGPHCGLGLPGMRERADELGGSVTPGRRTDGQPGSFVSAWFPR